MSAITSTPPSPPTAVPLASAVAVQIVVPFASDTTAATQARKILNKQRATMTDRRILLDPEADALAVELAKLTSAERIGSDVKHLCFDNRVV